MPFDKEAYRAARAAGQRGQGARERKATYYGIKPGYSNLILTPTMVTAADGTYISKKRHPEAYDQRAAEVMAEIDKREAAIKPTGKIADLMKGKKSEKATTK